MKLLKILQQKYIANTSWLMLERGLQMIITLLVGIKLARYMTEAEWGFYNWAASLVIIFAELARVGLPNITVKFLVNKDYSEEVIMGTSFIMKIIGSLFSFIIILLLVFLLEPSNHGRFLVMLVAFPYLIRTLDVIMYYFEAKVQSKFIVISRFTGILVNNILKLIVILTNQSVDWIYYIFTIDAIIFIALLLYFYKQQKHEIKEWTFDSSIAKKLLASSWPLIFSIMIYNLYMRIDQLMIKEMLGEAMNGNYAAATKLSSAWYAIPLLITGSIFPAIIKYYNTNYTLFILRFKTLYHFLILMALAIIIPITLWGDFLISIIYAGKYTLSSEVLKIHIWASIFVFIGYAGTKWLIVKDLERLSFLFIFFGCVVNIITNFIFIPKYGINGAAWATLFSQFTSYILMPLFHKESRIIFTTQIIAFFESLTLFIPIRNIFSLLKSLK